MDKTAIVIAGLAVLAVPAQAQRGGGRGAGGGAAATGGNAAPRPIDITAKAAFDMASVDAAARSLRRSAHRAMARTRAAARARRPMSDLLRSEIVVMDHAGRELPAFLAIGRPEKRCRSSICRTMMASISRRGCIIRSAVPRCGDSTPRLNVSQRRPEGGRSVLQRIGWESAAPVIRLPAI